MKKLPDDFLKNMKNLLSQEDYEQFLADSGKDCFRGIRVNTLKCSVEKCRSFLPFLGEKTPFCGKSFYIPFDTEAIGDEPFHHAGAFYVQEPSAACAVEVLDVQRGDKVLDLCAAPGGKSTQIAAELGGSGLLWCNEFVKSRANILLSNIERMGVTNAVVSSCHPDTLCSRIEGYFDKVLVDAPCSGEGMFRKDESAVSHWSQEHSLSCAERQLSILNSAAKALKNGGTLVYSTCTFSRCENEGVIERFLETHSDFELVESKAGFGRTAMEKAVRILPADGGEGHFAAKLKKLGQLERYPEAVTRQPDFTEKKAALKLYGEIFKSRVFGDNMQKIGDKIILLPNIELPQLGGLGVLRAGILFGEIKKNRVEPCHALFMAAKKEDLNSFVELGYSDSRLKNYYHGEEIRIPDGLKGFNAVFVEGVSTGFGKASSGVLKNRYPKGLRSNNHS